VSFQVNKEKYKNTFTGFRVTYAEGGAAGMVLGWAPTMVGYSMQGLCKFGFYEVFKNTYSGLIGEENTYLYRTSLYLAASASAEFFADIALSPMECVKVGWNGLSGLSGLSPETLYLNRKSYIFSKLRSSTETYE
jgi:solute carrier family 25 phosphate transporter 3